VTAPFAKSRPGAPAGFFAVEAAGLAWLRAAGGPAVPDVVDVGRERIVLSRVTEVAPTAHATEELGRGLRPATRGLPGRFHSK
jgi:fructosamine-3-kinase